ncbi:hypothetical protein Psed_6822 (plasmid) [Pseudonocardia dioxanivorans CB1190]|uniref:Uncharacterized protein n=1 Tax=Pseudonocardia dioxanivorans (strain ATCC 55486 / DSM 44775 / JCM 13855 / CB1190) TaxID=675635 RepID=F2L6J9_PSEUX|nr:hypothetical protein [Pseudonocardia dioxanivorans]AEA28893.1 hypothetical protein Psed_6822 [Pseudonocardia dioxanivorans CB1190]
MSAVEFSVSVVDLPAAEATPLAVAFDEHELVCGDDPGRGRVGIYLGATYTSTWGGYGAVADEHLPGLLRAVAPGATWLAWDDPHEGYLGSAALYAPDLGLWTGECDSSGAVYVLADALPRPEVVLADPAAVVTGTGLAWRDRVSECRSRIAADPSLGFVPTGRPVWAEWNRPTGLIYIDDPVEGTQVVHAPPGPALGAIGEPIARSAAAALGQAGWQLMPTALSGAPWSPAGHVTHLAQVYRPAPQAAPAAT